MFPPDILSTLREQRAEHARELESIDEAIRLLETVVSPARRIAAAKPKAPDPPPARRKPLGPRPTRKPVAQPMASAPVAGCALLPHEPLVAHTGRVPYGRGVERLNVDDRDEAIAVARRFLARGYRRRLTGQTEPGGRALKPGEFNVIPVGGKYAVVWVELPGEDRIAAKEAA